MSKKIIHTMGLYPDGSVKNNGVLEEDLPEHIKYQECRPGRAFFVDGICIYKGIGVSQEDIDKWEKQLAETPRLYAWHTRPYQ